MRYEDSQTGSFTDATPMARDDADHLAAADFGPATGNIITGSGTITGATGTDSGGNQIVAVQGAGGTDDSFAGGMLEVAGQYGVLRIDAEGNYSYARNPGTPEGVTDTFTYTLANAGGATDTAQLVINIGDTPILQAEGSQTVMTRDGVVVLPPGVELSDVRVVGRDLVITLPDGSTMVIPDGAVFVPQLVIDGVEVPASNLAALLIGAEPKPAAGDAPLQSSGGNFAAPVPPLDPGVPLGDLIPPTELSYTPPEQDEIQFLEDDEEPEIFIDPGDGNPVINAVDSVSELGLPTRNGGEPAGSGESADGNGADNDDASETTTGTIIIDSPDSPNVITITGFGGDVLVITGPEQIGEEVDGQYGTLTITSVDLEAGTVGYSYLLADNTSGDDTHDDFTVTVTDDDGDTATATLAINIIDDVPTANDDLGNQGSEDAPVTVNVFANDIPGADGVDIDNAPNVRVELVAGTLTGTGTLVYNNDGTFTYTPTPGEEGVVTFDYRIIDGDGDPSVATVTINLLDDTEPLIRTPENLVVDEDGLEGANDDSAPLQANPGETDSTESATDTGQVIVDFGNDVPDAPLIDSIELLDSAGLDGQLVDLDGNPVTFALNGSGQLVGTANGIPVIIISITAAAAGPGAGQVTYTYEAELLQPVRHADEGNNENTDLLSGVQFQVTDSDGDPATGSFSVTVVDDVPSAAVDVQLTGTVDEDGVLEGDADGGDGDGNAGGLEDVAGEDTTADGNVASLFVPSIDQPLTYSLLTDTSGLPALKSRGADVTYSVVGNTLTASANGEPVFTFTLDAETGDYVFTLLDQLDHPSLDGLEGDDTENPTDQDLAIQLGSIIQATDADGDSVTAAADGLVITVDDDSPQEFAECPDEVNTVNEIGFEFSGSLNLPPVGADEPGDVTFGVETGDPVLDTEDNPVTSGELELVYVVNGDVLEARAGGTTGELIFTITLNGDGTFTYEQVGSFGEGGTITFDDLSSTDAGNAQFAAVGADDAETTVDLLLSAEKDGASDTVNTDSDSIGSQNQSMDAGETVRIDFVTDLASGGATPSGFTYGAHVATTSFLGLIPQVQGEQDQTVALTVWALDSANTDAAEPDRDPTGGFSDSTVTEITEVTVKDYLSGESTTVAVSFTDGTTFVNVAYGISVRVNADGSVTFAGIQQGDSYGFSTGTGEFNAVAVQAEPDGTGGSTQDSFDLGIFSIGLANEFEPVDLKVPIVLTDFDGDSVVCDIDIHVGEPLVTADVTVTVNEAGLPELGSGAIGSESETNSEIQSGILTPSGGTGPYTFTLVGANADGDGDFGTLVLDPETGEFTYTLDTPFDTTPDADDGTNPELGKDSFEVLITDSLGATHTATITVNIIDDVPTANDDGNLDTVDDNAAGETIGTVAEILGNDEYGADGQGSPAIVIGPGSLGGTVTIVAGNLVYTAGAGGNVTPGNPNKVETFTYTIEDGDGDTETATFTVTLTDEGPSINQAAASIAVDEEGLGGLAGTVYVDGSDLAGQATTAGGTLAGLEFGVDGPGDITLAAVADTGLRTLSGGVVATSWDATTHTLTGYVDLDANGLDAGDTTVFTLQITDVELGTYSFQLFQPLRHTLNDNTETNATLDVAVTVTDEEGDPANGTISILIDDDSPLATDEAQRNVAEGATVTGTLDFATGADGGSITHINGIALTFGLDGFSDPIDIGPGSIKVKADGSYSFTAENPAASGVVNGTFTVTDGDGDTDIGAFSFNITDANSPTAGTSEARLDDDGLFVPADAVANGEAGDINANTGEVAPTDAGEDVFHGDLDFSFGGDGAGTINFAVMDGQNGTVGTETVIYDWDQATLTLTARTVGGTRPNTLLFTLELDDATSGEYTLTLENNVLHADDGGDNEASAPTVPLNFTVLDSDGSVSVPNGTLNITFNDDIPTLAITEGSDANIVLSTEDGATIGLNSDEAETGVDFSDYFNLTFTTGADGAAVTPTLAYQLGVLSPAVDSGLNQGGANIYLHLIDDVVVGSTASDPDLVTDGNTVFEISVSATGVVTLTQYSQIDHPAADDPGVGTDAPFTDHVISMADGLITLTASASITDGDGDTVSDSETVDIGGNIVFVDHGPSAATAVISETVDEDGIIETVGPDGDGIAGGPAGAGTFADVAGEETVATGDVSSLFNAGADTPLTFNLLTNTAALTAQNLKSNGAALSYDVDGNTLTGFVDLDANGLDAGDTTVFTFVLNSNGTYTFTLVDQLDHPTLNAAPGDNLENDLSIDLSSMIEAEDFDGDTATANAGQLVIVVDDDTPVAVNDNPTLEVELDPLGVEDIVGEWTDIDMTSGSTTNTDNDGDGAIDEIRWGIPIGSEQSGYGWVDNPDLATQTVLTNQPFSIGTFTHFNQPINPSGGPELDTVTLTVNFTAIIDGVEVNVGPIEIQFDHDETPNTGTAEQNRDIITITGQTATVMINGVEYELEVLGLIDQMGNVVTEVRTDEGANNSFELVVRFVNTESFELTGNVLTNDSSGADEPIEVVAAAGFGGDTDSRPHGNADTAMTVDGQYGTLTINADGSYTYTLTSDIEDVPDGAVEHFSYTIEDADGDGTTAELDITLDIDQAPQIDEVAVARTDDDGLGGNAASTTGDLNANASPPEVAPINVSEAIFKGQFEASGGDGALTYSLAHMHGQTGAVGTETVTYSWNGASNTLTAVITGGARTGGSLFNIVVDPATGAYTLNLLDNVLHAAGSDENDATTSLSFSVTDADGDAVFGDLNITFDDDAPTINTVTNPDQIDNSGTPTGEGTFAFAIGGDNNPDFDDISIDPDTFTVSINGGDPLDIASITEVSEDEHTAVYEFTFTYPTGEGSETDTRTGSLIFYKDGTNLPDHAAGTYEVILDGPIAAFTTIGTGDLADDAFTEYDINGGSPDIVVASLTETLFAQFTAFSTENNSPFTALKTTDYGEVDPPAPADGDPDSSWAAGELFTANVGNPQVSEEDAGVDGNTMDTGEVLDFNLYSTDPGNTLGGTPTTSAGTMFIQFFQYAGDDLIIVLKLMDPDTGEFTTRAVMVSSTDVYTNSAADTAALAGTSFAGLSAGLGNQDALLIIEPNDYNAGTENWVIVGAQILTDENGVSGTAIDLNRAVNGELGTEGSSDRDGDGDFNTDSGTAALDEQDSFSNDTDVSGVKITSIGFLVPDSTDQSATIDFDVTVTDADGDTDTASITVQIGDPPAEPLLASTMMVNQEPVDESASMSLLSADSQDQQLQRTAANSNTTIFTAAVAAAGLAGAPAAASNGHAWGNGGDSSLTGMIAGLEPAGFNSTYEPSAFSALLSNGSFGDAGFAGSEASSGFSAFNQFNGNPGELVGGGGVDMNLGALSGGTDVPAMQMSAPAPSAAASVAMPSAEAMVAAGLAGGAKQNAVVEKIVADALEGGGNGPDIDALLAALPAQESGANPALDALASASGAGVPAWHMGLAGGFTFDALANITAEALVLHHDVVPPTANG